jgi:diguanylate cyclase (GGDEF)-like protein
VPPPRADRAGVEAARDPADGRDFGGALTRLLLSYAEEVGGEAAVAEVCRLAGDDRDPAVLRRDDTWSTHEQGRRLCEAVAATCGGTASLAGLGTRVWSAGNPTAVGDFLAALGSPDAVFDVLPHLVSRLEPHLDTETERVGDGCWLVRVRFVDGFAPFREHCAFASGLVGHLPAVFGHAARPAVEEACQVAGDHACTFRVTWDAHGRDDTDALVAELDLRARALEGRILALEQTIGELVSGESLDVVLARVVEAAAQAVLAQGVVLAVTGARAWWDGLSPEEGEAVASAALGDGPIDPRWTVVDVRSRRADYGRLVALHHEPIERGHQRLILEAYGRVAAAALDSTAVLEEATRQAEMANALLQLSQSLAEIGTSEEMAQRVATAVPAVVDCDQVVVSLREPDGHHARVVAVHGYGPERDASIVGFVAPIDDTFLDEHVRVLRQTDDLSAVQRPLLGGAAALASVPLHAGGEVLGWIAVIVQDRPARLVDEPQLGDRLRGLAGQAATAMRNARLLDQMRFQAEHDPLTGLANQRLLHVHATQAIARARRDGTRVGLLFLDLDDFKDVNDTLGHAEGDRLLQLVTDRLRATLRDGDTVARFGGDEFVVLLPSLTDDGSTVASKITLALADRFLIGGHDVRVSTSIGAAVFPDDGNDFGELLKQADIRMYRSKVARRAGQASRVST